MNRADARSVCSSLLALVFLAFAGLAVPAVPASAQSAVPPASAQPDPPPTTAPKASIRNYHLRPAAGPIVIDGLVDDAGWKNAIEISDFYEFRPGDGIPSRVRTVARITYDAEHAYFMFRCFDPDPTQIRAHLADRDHIYDDDMVGMQLDTFLDHRTGFEFLVNPRGIQGDLAVSNGGDEDDSFDALWYSAAHVDSLGWTAEISIPTKSIRFRDLPVSEWGVWLFRNYPRDSRYQLASHKMNRDEPCWACQFDHVDSLAGLVAGRNLEVLPYFSQSSSGTRDRFGAPFVTQSDPKVGFCLKYGLTASVTLDATVRPDFAQVEADQDVINVNTQSAITFSERRPFFLEGSGIFGGNGGLLYTRNVGDPSVAGKVTGREGPYQFGFMAAHDRLTSLIYPFHDGSALYEAMDIPSDDVVLRVRRDLLKDSNVGFIGTSRSYGGAWNRVGALDGTLRFQERMRFNWLLIGTGTQDLPGVGDNQDSLSGSHSAIGMYGELNYNSRHYNGSAWYTRKDPFFRADMGSQDQNDLRAVESWQDLEYSPAGKVVDYIQPSIYTQYQKDHAGRLMEQVFQPQLHVNLKHQWEINLANAFRFSRYFNSRLNREIATHRTALRLNVNKRGSGLLSGDGQGRIAEDIYYGGAVLGRARGLNANLNIRPTSNLQATVGGQFYDLRHMDADLLYVRQLLGLLRVTYQFSPRLFMRVLSQYSQADYPATTPIRSLNNQFLLSYKVNYATVFFLGLNGDYENELLTDKPGQYDYEIRPSVTPASRQLFAKFQYFWRD